MIFAIQKVQTQEKPKMTCLENKTFGKFTHSGIAIYKLGQNMGIVAWRCLKYTVLRVRNCLKPWADSGTAENGISELFIIILILTFVWDILHKKVGKGLKQGCTCLHSQSLIYFIFLPQIAVH